MIIPLGDVKPKIHRSVFVAETAQVIGDVTLGEGVSVWFNSVIRGDTGRVIVGKQSNIQDGCILHPEFESPVIIGDNVTMGHGAVAHSCRIGSNSLIGMRAVILDKAEVGEECIIGACSLVTEGTKIPPRTVAWGVPARPVRKVTSDDLRLIKDRILEYLKLSKMYRQ